MSCSWWRRWWHARLRRLDRALMAPALARAAQRYSDPAERERKLVQARALFIGDRGQEHWRCACAAEEPPL